MRWRLSWRADPAARALADRHYNRQSPDSDQFVPPGRCVVLVIPDVAFWVTSWPFAEWTKHAWAGAWVCSAFRNERPDLHQSSGLIVEAVAATRALFGDPPTLGMVTFVDATKTRRKRDPGRCYLRAGFQYATCEACAGTGDLLGARCPACGGDGRARTKSDRLFVLAQLPDAMPAPVRPLGSTLSLFGGA